ncbi:PPR domain-containing protein/PPR_2 domain-containing protein [Cephalotus follicularis]|uniref:PPR domain-containing protein/PPR_2 domain-containing protein n=1 Tax=Cephalotus follicularis TaxID=3775 RepID=A0A1Q3BU28_CEPFO|nr:PPR domain-containing protein/PPR_2 domain-containing protein [Cephalotus follicularis]
MNRMFSFALPPSNYSHLGAVSHEKVPSTKSANFAQIPSWATLRTSPTTSLNAPHNQHGQVENVYLMALYKQGKLKEAYEFITEIDKAGVSVSPHSYQCLFETCAKSKLLSDGRLIHDWMRRNLKNPSGFLENCVIQMYCDCGSLSEAQKVFDEMLERNRFSWIIIISAYANGGLLSNAFGLFSRMIELGIKPNSSIYTSLLKSLNNPSVLEIGKQMHCHVIKSGLVSSASIETAISNMYVKCRWLEGAELVFDRMVKKNAIAWTGLMVGYTQAENKEDALKLFVKMVREGVELDDFVFSIVLKACAGLENLNLGRQIHGHILKLGLESEVSVGTPLVDFYVKCASFQSACRAFDRINEPNDVSWSALVCGYCQTGEFEEFFKVFQSIRFKSLLLNSFIYTNIFQACSVLADFNTGAQVHADAIKRGLVADLHGESALITMYSKCGRLDHANQAFESINEADTVGWTAIISGHAYHGNAFEALKLFRRMVEFGVRPNAVTFVAVLTACSHSGLVTEAKQFLDTMSGEYDVNPTIDHYDCMIDVYSRAGLLNEALDLITRNGALYQLHLVKAETARAFIPKEFRLVEAFGYTLGGFFLASYDHSPAGVFDELVVIAGLVWNPPTSCAWAAKVLVNSDEACDHGRKYVGLPSQVARFSKRITSIPGKPKSKFSGFLNMMGMGTTVGSPNDCMDVQVTEISRPAATDVCSINLTTPVPVLNKCMGPAIKMSLPSFSGRTQYNPNLLKYSCQIECRVRAVQPAKVCGLSRGDQRQSFGQDTSTTEDLTHTGQKLSVSVLLSKPILALEFTSLEMQVEAPTVISHCPKPEGC